MGIRRSRENVAPPKGNSGDASCESDALVQWARSLAERLTMSSEDFVRLRGATVAEIASGLGRMPEPVDAKFVASIQEAVRVASDPIHAAVVTRGIEAVTRLSAALDVPESARVLANATDQSLLLELLEEVPSARSDPPHDPLAEARRRGLHMRDEILQAEGGVWSASEVGQHLHITRQAVERRRRGGRLLGLPIGGKAYAYPRWQFDDDGVLPGFVESLAAFQVSGVWTRAAFFLSANTLLNGARPLDELRRGNVDAVTRAAASLGDQIAA